MHRCNKVAFCVQDNEPALDHLVEVTFTGNPRIRRIGAHDPSTLSHAEYMRQIFWSSGAVVSEDIEAAIQRVTLDLTELQPGEKAAMSLTLPKGLFIAFDPVTHATLFLEVAGDETSERRSLSVVLADAHAHFGSTKLQPGPARIAFENKSGQWRLANRSAFSENACPRRSSTVNRQIRVPAEANSVTLSSQVL
jgi:hypothetical protein